MTGSISKSAVASLQLVTPGRLNYHLLNWGGWLVVAAHEPSLTPQALQNASIASSGYETVRRFREQS
jgi:hypothetical protein